MDIVERTRGHVTILDLKGHLVWEDGCQQLRARLNRLAAERKVNVVLNMDAVDYLDSAGVGLIASKYVTMQRHGGRLKLCQLHPRSYRVLDITKLLTIFESFDKEDDAVASFVKAEE
jgi:anti-sigma B factor antagonist